MTEEVKTEDESRRNFEIEAARWHFWFIVSFSLFLIITFIFYLPLQFRHQVTTGGHDEAMEKQMENMPGGDAHDGGHGAVAHEEGDVLEGLAVNFTAVPMFPVVGATTTLEFFVNLKPQGVFVQPFDLEIGHEKLMHVIGVRSDMNEFFHIHPHEPGYSVNFTSEYVFKKPGRYKIWSEIKKDGVVHAFGHPSIDVVGEGVREEKNVSFGRSVVVSGYQVVLATNEPIGKGVDHDLYFDIHDVEGNEVDVEQYLGADMHLSLIKDDWSEFIHAHPVDHGGHEMMEDEHTHSMRSVPDARAHTGPTTKEQADDMINFHVVFPSAGLYRAYAQFRPAGTSLAPDEALVAMFWIRVEEQVVQKALPQTQWRGLFVVSIILMTILGWGVKRYLIQK